MNSEIVKLSYQSIINFVPKIVYLKLKWCRSFYSKLTIFSLSILIKHDISTQKVFWFSTVSIHLYFSYEEKIIIKDVYEL